MLYTIRPQARTDLDAIWDYIAADNVAAVDRLLSRFEERFLMLSRQPLLGEACEHLQDGLRNFPVGSYVIFYLPHARVFMWSVSCMAPAISMHCSDRHLDRRWYSQ